MTRQEQDLPGERREATAAGTFSCVIDTHPRFHLDALRWFASLTRLAGVAPADLVVHTVGPAQSDVLDYLRARGVTVREIQLFDSRSLHCNKIAGALRLAAERQRGQAVLTDSDVVMFDDPRRIQVPAGKVGMTPVHMANPPIAVLSAVFAAAGLPLPRRTAIQLQPGQFTVAGNGNGGLYLVPGALLPDVARAWAQWARWLLDRRDLLAAWAFHVDQVAMALALAAEKIETCELDVRWNFPIHVSAIIPADPPVPGIIHYHQWLDAAGQISPTGHAALDRRIREANAALDGLWREEFPNATFWEWRYLTNPDLGSGVGSRGELLLHKRALLNALLDCLKPASVLDVGCGDGEATRGLSIASYIGIDLSGEAVRRAGASRPGGDFRIGTLADHPVQADLAICLDVLIHQAVPATYHDLVGRLLRAATRALVISGYERPIRPTLPTVHFHEPLSTTLHRLEPAAELYPLREEHEIVTYLVLKAKPNRHARDLGAEVVRTLVELLVQRAALVDDLQAQRAAVAAELAAQLRANERLAQDNRALEGLQRTLSSELARWRERVAALEATRAFRLRAWLLRLRRGAGRQAAAAAAAWRSLRSRYSRAMTTPRQLPNTFERELSSDEIARDGHRESVGGLWHELGALQLDFMIRHGLRPDMRFLDLGCGCLRGGVRFIEFLDPGNYYGLDANASLLRCGWEIELPRAKLAGRLPRQNLLLNRDFEAWRFGASFDMVLAQSVFTHLPQDWLRRCLVELARCVHPGGSFFATYFHCPADWPEGEPRLDAAHGGTTFWDRDPFHYREEDLEAAADSRIWQVEHLRGWGHPRGQWMVRFRRLPG
ncbi:MAG: class I SAM-dependent methyltransferase [Acidobacteria bacterium]|nr:class I SAM-dependent methyltransferase [Acidobacteriota bacterium]